MVSYQELFAEEPFPLLCFQHSIYPSTAFDNLSERNYFQFLILTLVYQYSLVKKKKSQCLISNIGI